MPYVDERAAELVFRHRVIWFLQDEGLLLAVPGTHTTTTDREEIHSAA